MKKTLASVISMAVSLFAGFAQEDEYCPTTTWPYVYSDFSQGKLRTYDGKDKDGVFNICIANGTVHFIEDGFVKEIAPTMAFSAEIEKDLYVNVRAKMMKVLAKNDNGLVARGTEIDEVSLNSTGGAYGSSTATTGNTALTSLEGIGSTGSISSLNHMELKNAKSNGKELSLLTKTYLVVDGKVIFATKKDVSENVDPEAFKLFLKEHKIKWNDPVCLLELVDFVHSQK